MRVRFDVIATLVALSAVGGCSKSASKGTPSDTSTPHGDGGGGAIVEKGPAGDDRAPSDGSGPPPPPKVTTTNETVDVDGAPRDYVLSVPNNYDAGRSYPLIVALHGDGGTAAGFAATSKLDAATGDEAILAFPNGSVDLLTPYAQNEDQRLIELVIEAVKQNYSIDASKIWGFGYSKGAYQLNEIACKRPGLLKAMAIHAGGAPQPNERKVISCPTAVGLPVFVTHGARDKPGGEYCAAFWADFAGCKSSRSPSSPAMCEVHDDCEAGKPVVFCLVPNHPHSPMYADAAAHSWAWFKTL